MKGPARRRRVTALGAIAVVVLVASAARGQPLVERSFATQLFEPAIGADPLLSVETASMASHLGFQLRLMVSYQREPLVVSSQVVDPVTGQPVVADFVSDVSLVANQMTTDIGATLGLRYRWLRAELGVGFPVHVLLSGNEVGPAGRKSGDLSGAGIGDLRLQLKLLVLPRRKGIAVALAPVVTVPTACATADSCADDGRYHGEASATFRPRVVADFRAGPLLVAANIGWIFREDQHVFSSTVGDRLLYGVGASYAVARRAQVLAEVYGQAGVGGDECRDTTAGGTSGGVCNDGSNGINSYPLEGLLAGRYLFGNGFGVMAGGGVGLIRGIGAPQFRLLAGLQWKPDFSDRDGDGVLDSADACPTQAEDKDGYRDADGCPEVDNDGDLIPDDKDKCPNQAEDRDGFADTDGCPDKDNDGDGIADRLDHCPFKPETKNKYKDDDGCPDVLDRDRDGIEDARDKCVSEPETINGHEDGDGCPDEGDLRVGENEIELLKPIRFRGGKIRQSSHATLDQVALALKHLPAIKRLAIRARAKRVRGRRGKRWQARIEAVRQYLVGRGVGVGRLVADAPEKLERVDGKLPRKGIVLAIVEREASK